MRLGYFGGSFDPPHIGHLAVARAARDRFGLDRVLLAPTGRQPLKPDGPTAPFADRVRMVELLCADEPGLEPSAIDAPQPDGRPNYTVDTLRQLHATVPASAELFAIAGADSFLTLPKWRDPAGLLAAAQWIVVSRPGVALSQLDNVLPDPAQRSRIHVLADLEIPVSATDLRRCLREHLSCADLLPSPVLAYIRTNHLYVT